MDLRSASTLVRRQTQGGASLVEIAIAVALLGLVAAGSSATLITLNKNAAGTRIMTNAKEIVQRNIEAASCAPFTSANVPAILAITSSSGALWDDDGGGDNLETIYTSRDGSAKVTGTLLRTVRAETNAVSADIRRITFHMDYSLFGRAQTYEMTTLRAMDK